MGTLDDAIAEMRSLREADEARALLRERRKYTAHTLGPWLSGSFQLPCGHHVLDWDTRRDGITVECPRCDRGYDLLVHLGFDELTYRDR